MDLYAFHFTSSVCTRTYAIPSYLPFPPLSTTANVQPRPRPKPPAHNHPLLAPTARAMFHSFPALPAELRARIWTEALQEEYSDLMGCSRFIEIHTYNPDLEEFSLTISRRYPSLFHVTREARYEAAKADGGEWITLNGRYCSKRTTSTRPGVEICVNFARDTFLISNRFTKSDIEDVVDEDCNSAEEARLAMMSKLMPSTAPKVAYRASAYYSLRPHQFSRESYDLSFIFPSPR